jgi:probable phosphoglycerate mutase
MLLRQRVFLIRHSETQWSLSGRHTGVTDVPLTENGRAAAKRLTGVLAGKRFALVLVSPLQRTRETCELAGLGQGSTVTNDLVEWNYGEYEGLTSQQIRAENPKWLIFRDGCPGGESTDQIGARVDRVIARVRSVERDVAVFSHGHLLRVFVARWLGLPVSGGCHFFLDTATLSVLSDYHGAGAIERWNTSLVD